MGQPGAIATPHHLASAAGEKALGAGGSAVDATIAAAAVLAVVYPHMTGLGGDSWSLLRSSAGETLAINGTGMHPRGVDVEALTATHGSSMPLFGAASSPVPGAVKAWGSLHAAAGRLDWSTLMADALALAKEGVEVAPSLARDLESLWPEISIDPGVRNIFSSARGGPKKVGETLHQPELALSLHALASDGPDAFYHGDLARQLSEGMRTLGSEVSAEDFALQESEILSPLRVTYRDHQVWTAPPNSQGFTLAQMLKILERNDVDLDDPDYRGTLASLFGLSNTEREEYLADPHFAEVNLEELLSNHHTQELFERARAGQSVSGNSQPRASGDTVGIAAIDANGVAVSSLHSIFYSFGARVLDPATGIVLQNRSASFSLNRHHRAYLRPGSRPPSTLLPVLIDHPDGTLSSIATMGGRSQAQIQAQLIGRITQGQSPEAVVAERRFVVGAFGPDLEEALVGEETVSDPVRKELGGRGFMVTDSDDFDDRCGHAQIVQINSRGFAVGSDPRADGKRTNP